MTESITVITTSEVARRRGVDSSTVRKWVAEGSVVPLDTTIGGHYRFNASDFPDLALLTPETSTTSKAVA